MERITMWESSSFEDMTVMLIAQEKDLIQKAVKKKFWYG